MSFGVDMNTTMFFDSQAVIDALDKAERKNHGKIGGKIRKAGRRKLRRRKRTSKPGQAPSVRSRGRASLKNILYGMDMRSHEVVIGPVKINTPTRLQGTATTVPELMESGGTVRQRNWQESVEYEPRPFMGPALDDEIKKGTIADVWQDSVRG